jgi:hypothetical protein
MRHIGKHKSRKTVIRAVGKSIEQGGDCVKRLSLSCSQPGYAMLA